MPLRLPVCGHDGGVQALVDASGMDAVDFHRAPLCWATLVVLAPYQGSSKSKLADEPAGQFVSCHFLKVHMQQLITFGDLVDRCVVDG